MPQSILKGDTVRLYTCYKYVHLKYTLLTWYHREYTPCVVWSKNIDKKGSYPHNLAQNDEL